MMLKVVFGDTFLSSSVYLMLKIVWRYVSLFSSSGFMLKAVFGDTFLSSSVYLMLKVVFGDTFPSSVLSAERCSKSKLCWVILSPLLV